MKLLYRYMGSDKWGQSRNQKESILQDNATDFLVFTLASNKASINLPGLISCRTILFADIAVHHRITQLDPAVDSLVKHRRLGVVPLS